ncbi:MAG: rRNA pseudouridine synthase [Ruminococcus sp.]|nr:rRNA pseudouridine synthase [Ruminococcus sp.]
MVKGIPAETLILLKEEAMIRLDKYISERTEYTRSSIRDLVRKKQITVDGITAKAPDMKIDPETASVCVCGNEVRASEYRYVLLNKPEGYVCSTSEHDGRNVMELIPPEMRAKDMFPAGRLDKDSLGALLLTNDGGLAHRILSPSRHIPKIYIVKLDRVFQNNYVDQFKNGIKLDVNETCLPAKVRRAENCDTLAFVELHEGKFHQVKRMFKAVDNSVEKLMRVSYGGLILPETLGFGECVELLHKDVENLFSPPDFDAFCEEFDSVFSAILTKPITSTLAIKYLANQAKV